jgi:hypothetical protein
MTQHAGEREIEANHLPTEDDDLKVVAAKNVARADAIGAARRQTIGSVLP